MDQLSPQDAQFLYIESEHNLAHVTSVTLFDPSTVPGGKTVRFKDIIAHVEERLQASPLLKRKLVRVPLVLLTDLSEGFALKTPAEARPLAAKLIALLLYIGLGFFAGLEGVGVWIGLATGLACAALLLTWRWMLRERLGLVVRAA